MEQPTPIKPPVDPVARSIARPDAFAKPGSLATGKGMRFRPLAVKRPPGRPRKHPEDKRHVTFY
jgi:hypothetical protein